MATQRLMTILILFLAGCVETSAPVPQASPEATIQIATANPSTEQAPAIVSTAAVTEPDSTAVTEPVNEITGKVVVVIDGDTIDLLTADRTTIRIRLNGIDAPEIGQPYGRRATRLLSHMIGEQIVSVVTHGEDQEGRRIGDVYYFSVNAENFSRSASQDELCINREMVKQGLAWHDKQFSDDAKLSVDEGRARGQKLELWSDPRHIPPWEWQKLSQDEREKLR